MIPIGREFQLGAGLQLCKGSVFILRAKEVCRGLLKTQPWGEIKSLWCIRTLLPNIMQRKCLWLKDSEPSVRVRRQPDVWPHWWGGRNSRDLKVVRSIGLRDRLRGCVGLETDGSVCLEFWFCWIARPDQASTTTGTTSTEAWCSAHPQARSKNIGWTELDSGCNILSIFYLEFKVKRRKLPVCSAPLLGDKTIGITRLNIREEIY